MDRGQKEKQIQTKRHRGREERERERKEKEEKRENESKTQGAEKRNRERERERQRERKREGQRDADTEKFGACSTSLSGGNQVDGLPPVVHIHSENKNYQLTFNIIIHQNFVQSANKYRLSLTPLHSN